ncbi:hypothetical protein [Methanosphaera sp. WGK6]|uniref:hypothetical protein n=1 Tax=Methanosphaera sp. WGK6 TaxID=1561964 RepID=UPI00084C076B|nr:hypothetical protein [Methanosphaera sp. WGK6]OED30797.1 hypothetical protein NL43_00300 [Methanosphaera sp. WGK6]
MSRFLKIILFILGIFIFFEIGLFASYSVISSSPVDPVELVSVQIDGVSDFIDSFTGEENLNDQDTLNITNDEDVALILNNLTNLSVNLNSVTTKIASDDTGNQTVTITAIATKDTQITSGGAIQIVPEQTYSITATAIGEVYSSGKVKINITSISLKERIVLYNQNNSSSNSSIENLIQYSQNNTTSTNNTTAITSNGSSRARA